MLFPLSCNSTAAVLWLQKVSKKFFHNANDFFLYTDGHNVYLLQAKIGNNSQIVELFPEKMNSKSHFLSFSKIQAGLIEKERPMWSLS